MQALEGIRILDFGAYFAGPYAPKMLGDLGAEVIKIEPPAGDPMRPLDSVFCAAQRGKRCIALDLKAEEGRAIVHQLAKTAQMVCHNMRPGVAERLGIGFQDLKKINPNIIYLFAPGWGSSGPKSHLQSFAPLFSGYSGIQWESAGRGNPPIGGVSNEDYFNSLLGACSLLMGALRQAATGEAQYVEGPQLNSALFATSEVVLTPDNETLFAFEVDERQRGFGPLYGLYETSDGWLCIAAVRERDWAALTSVPPFAELAADARFDDAGSRHAHADDLTRELAAKFKGMPAQQAFTLLDQAGVPCEIPRDAYGEDYFWEDENVAAGRVVEYESAKWGKMREIGQTIRLSDTPGAIKGPAPLLGEHTREILAELGHTAEQIDDLKARGIVEWQEMSAATP